MKAEDRGKRIRVRTYGVKICDGCIGLKGKMCNTPECAFCRKSIAEIAKLLEACQLRFCANGKIIEPTETTAEFQQALRLRRENAKPLRCIGGCGQIMSGVVESDGGVRVTCGSDACSERARLILEGS